MDNNKDNKNEYIDIIEAIKKKYDVSDKKEVYIFHKLNKENAKYHIFKGYIIPTKTHIENSYSAILYENSMCNTTGDKSDFDSLEIINYLSKNTINIDGQDIIVYHSIYNYNTLCVSGIEEARIIYNNMENICPNCNI
ncbi:hypothetical protein [Brachyspira aalborgi]|uniref:Uncharacterized protein n=1 Tax=Brachyspira aalborgi TaxID=29522 RepID=A0A5C8EDY0_9SPIR|nr:hypothetical protein [Brachyspira aalborgi]TXJ36219.1 hypothetical protein EPJ78_09555 [Brachyspira aalborgi]